jgi:uncharacterized Rmd1/YagE family protein
MEVVVVKIEKEVDLLNHQEVQEVVEVIMEEAEIVIPQHNQQNQAIVHLLVIMLLILQPKFKNKR